MNQQRMIPIFVAAAGGTAIVIILLCVTAGLRWPGALPIRWAARTGEVALTIYFGHVLIGMGVLDAIGRLDAQTLWFALGSAVVFIAASVVFAVVWRRYRRRGPVEWLMRRLSG